jgi:hypothetical protein
MVGVGFKAVWVGFWGGGGVWYFIKNEKMTLVSNHTLEKHLATALIKEHA